MTVVRRSLVGYRLARRWSSRISITCSTLGTAARGKFGVLQVYVIYVSRMPAPRARSVTAARKRTAPKAVTTQNAMPTGTSETPRKPYRKTFTM